MNTYDKNVGADYQELDLLRQMIRIRRFEEKCAELYTKAKIRGFLHLYIGEEAVSVGLGTALRPEDAVIATYREHGHALVRGISMNSIMAEMYGKMEGCSRGRGGSMHLFDAATHFYGGSAIVAGGIPMAVGLALAARMQQRNQIIVCLFGEGAVAEGVFHESMNLAALWQVPVLFVCENNLYAMGTRLERSESQTDICRKLDSYGIPSLHIDGMDVLAVRDAAQKAASEIRNDGRPRFLECQTYRFRAHSMFDAQLYRSKTEVQEWMEHDPIKELFHKLEKESKIESAKIQEISAEVDAEIAAAVDFAEAGTWEAIDDLCYDVYTTETEK